MLQNLYQCSYICNGGCKGEARSAIAPLSKVPQGIQKMDVLT